MSNAMDVKLLHFAENVGAEWKKLCVYLGLKWSRIHQLQADSKFSTKETITNALIEWQRGFSNDINTVKRELRNINSAILSSKSPIRWEDGDIDDDKFLYQVGEDIGGVKWKELALILKFQKGRIDSFERDNALCVTDAIMDMLVSWRSSCEDASRCLPNLLSALQRVGCDDVAAKVARNIRANPRILIDPADLEWVLDKERNARKIGSGGYADIYQATYLFEIVAVKLIHFGSTLPENIKRKLSREVQSMQHLHDQHTVDLLGLLIDDVNCKYGIVMTYMPNGSLMELLEKILVPWSVKTQVCRDVCSGMAHLHKSKLVHGDLKPANVLLDAHYRGKVSDFGQARFVDATSTLSRNVVGGTFTHLAPEAFDDEDCLLKPESDVWSFGILTFEVAAEKKRYSDEGNNRLPYNSGITTQRIINKLCTKQETPVSQGQIHEKITDDCPSCFVQVAQDCCKIELSVRPQFKQLLETFTEVFTGQYSKVIKQDVDELHTLINGGVDKHHKDEKHKVDESNNPANSQLVQENVVELQRFLHENKEAGVPIPTRSEQEIHQNSSELNTELDSTSETACSSLSNCWNGHGRQLLSKTLSIETVVEISSWINQLLVIGGEVWALMYDRIYMFDIHELSDLSKQSSQKTYTFRIEGSNDMCCVKLPRSAGVLVAADSGLWLVLLETIHESPRQVEPGKHWSVTCNHTVVWALKEHDEVVYLLKYILDEHVDAGLMLTQSFETSLKSSGSAMYCAVLGEAVYICCRSHDCIYVVNVDNGHTIIQYGRRGYEAPGEFYGPTTIYADEDNQLVIITDQCNNRLQVYQPALHKWTVVEVAGTAVNKPRALSMDSTGRLWMCGMDPHQLSRGTFT